MVLLQGAVVQKMDNAIYRINLYPLDNAIVFPNTYPLDSDLSGGQRYPTFEQLGPDHLLHQALEKCKKECNMLYFKLNYPGTRFLSTENKNYSMSWWILS